MVRTPVILLGAGLLVSALHPAPGAGQEAGSEAPSDTLPAFTLRGVEVTVLRTPVAAVSAPRAVAVLGRPELTRGKGGFFLHEALASMPGLQVQNRFNDAVGERLSVRGFGARAQFGVRGIRILVDGIPATLPDGQSTLDHLDLGSLGRVELLRGSGADLYGNASGGVLKFQSRPPPAGLDLEAVGVAGSFGARRLQVSGAGRSGETGYLASLSMHRFQGFRTDPSDPDGTYGASERLRLNATLSTPLGGGVLAAVINAAGLDAENPGSLSDSLLALGERQAYGFNVFQRTDKQVAQGQAGLTWTRQGDRSRTEFAGWLLRRDVDSRIPNTVIDLGRYAGGLRAARAGTLGNRRPLDITVGLEGQLQSDDRTNRENDGGEAGTLTLDQAERVATAAPFVGLEWAAAGNLLLSSALRYDFYRLEVDDRLVPPGGPDDSGSRTLDAFTPSLGARWEFHPGMSLYANFSTYFEIPTTTELANRPSGAGGFNPDLDPASGRSWEAGLRGASSPVWGWEVVGFWIDGKDELVPFEVESDPGRTYFRNAGESTRKGAEITLWAAPAPWMDVRGSLTRTDARFDRYQVDGESLAGNRIPGLAPTLVDLVAHGRRGGFNAEVRYLWSDEVPVDDRGSAAPAPSYQLVDVRLGWDGLDLGPTSVSLYGGVTNVLDERYVSSVVVNAFGGRYYEPGPPRGVYLGLSVQGPAGASGPAR
jgi:iron complex outermembrane receptor protein